MAALQHAVGAKSQGGRGELHKRILRIKGLRPLFTDFTWAAGGFMSELTLKFTSAAKNEMGTVACMHLDCANLKGELVIEALAECKKDGVRNNVGCARRAPTRPTTAASSPLVP